ncbi:hypothetical protein Tco_0371268 [Tanacetum coccineum]
MNSILCLWCDNNIESTDHALVLCENAMKIWDMVFACGGIGPVNVFTSKEIPQNKWWWVAVTRGAKKLRMQSFEWSCRRSKKYVFRWEQWLERPSMCGMSMGKIA